MRILVTGSAGFVGRHLVQACKQRGHDLVCCDLKQGWDCRDLFRSDDSHFDLVFHCAATVGGREGIDHNAALLGANNFQLDGAMFEWALHTKPGRIVYFSSAAAYPVQLQAAGFQCRMGEQHINLDDYSGAPDESYGWAKLMGEMVAQRVRNTGVPITIVRPFSSYDFDQDDCYPFPEFAKRAHRRENPFTVWGNGKQTRDLIHVDDLVNAIFALVDAEVDGPVNLGTGIATSMDELARMFMAEAGYDAPIRHELDKPMGVMFRVCDNTELLKYYTPRISVHEGVRRSLDALDVRLAA